ncbi:unnamed protein product [Alternaria sp. RS040]
MKMELESGADDAPVFFFESDQSNGFLSQEFLSSLGGEFNCNEQFYQALKATFFMDNYELCMAIRNATDPKEQKALGKHIKANDASWAQHWGFGSRTYWALAWKEFARGSADGGEVEFEREGKLAGREEGVFDGEVSSIIFYDNVF